MKQRARLLRVILPLCAAIAFHSGCDLFAPPMNTPPVTGNEPAPLPPAPTINIDGQWRHAAAGTLRETCITIANSRITQIDDGCNGNLLQLFSTPPLQGQSGSPIVRLLASFSDTPDEFVNGGIYTYELVPGPGDTLQGTGILRIEPSGPVLIGEVTWVRN